MMAQKPNKRSYFGGPGRLEGLGFGIQGLMRMQGSGLWLLLGFKSEGSQVMVPEFKSFGLRVLDFGVGFGFPAHGTVSWVCCRSTAGARFRVLRQRQTLNPKPQTLTRQTLKPGFL